VPRGRAWSDRPSRLRTLAARGAGRIGSIVCWRSIIRHDTLDGDGDGDGDVQGLPAGAARPAPAPPNAGDAMADAVDTAELLGVEVQELARSLALIADDRRPRLERGPPAEAVAAQDAADRRDRPAEPAGDRRGRQPLAAPLDDLGLGRRVEPERAAVRPRRATDEPGGALDGETIAPLAHRPRIDAVRRGHRPHAPTRRQPGDHQPSTMPRRSGILVNVHPRLPVGRSSVWQPQPPFHAAGGQPP